VLASRGQVAPYTFNLKIKVNAMSNLSLQVSDLATMFATVANQVVKPTANKNGRPDKANQSTYA